MVRKYRLTLVMATGIFLAGFPAWALDKAPARAAIETGRFDIDEGLGLTPEQAARIKSVREAFRARQQAIKDEISAKNEALRQELDSELPVRAKVDAVLVQIKALQAALLDSRVDVVFALRELYTPAQVRLIKERLEKHRQELPSRKTKKVRTLERKKSGTAK